MSQIILAPIDVAYTLNTTIKIRKVEDFPIMTQKPKMNYENIKTYQIVKKSKPTFDINKVMGFATMNKFNPQDLGLPK